MGVSNPEQRAQKAKQGVYRVRLPGRSEGPSRVNSEGLLSTGLQG